VTDIMNLLNI